MSFFFCFFFFFKQKTAYEIQGDWSSDVCSSDLKDFRLLVELNENARRSFQALGWRVTLSAPAVRDRIRRLEERGVVQGYWVSIDPAVRSEERRVGKECRVRWEEGR